MPTPLFLDPSRLRDMSRFFADEVSAGKYPYSFTLGSQAPLVDYSASDRWHQRIYRDQRMDVWLISWLPTQGTQLHDHGGSAGSFSVLTGELTETVVARGPGGDRARDLVRGAGSTVGFGARYVHDVRNLGSAPAVSVHVYSAPLSSMTYYDLADGRLQPLVTVATDDPELELDVAS